MSRLTIASLADLGYQVDLGVAEPYSLPGGFAGLRAASADDEGTVLRPVPGAA